MLGRLFGRDTERATGDPHVLPVPRKKNGMYPLRALGDTRVLALVEAADAADWTAVQEALAPSISATTTRSSVNSPTWTAYRTGSAGPSRRTANTGRPPC
ncbi:hypothetical protein SHKM778_43340 [Streptomyces sp. KM77-8]|uniref:Uncharacterized protein n=1 Tax=Streptomyces haneummycinicus TaxID=3074435 RepID=A0AAT9HKT5_9ACTN